MPNTINNFLVGIGFDLDKKSTDSVASGIDGVKSKALQLGSVVAGAFGIKALTNDFASAKDELGKFAEVFGVSADDVNAFGNAMRLEGGTLEGFMSQLASLEKFRAGLATGDAGFIEAAGRAGLDIKGLIEAENATEGFLNLADQFQRMNQQQRLNAASALGLDDASIRLLSNGREEILKVVDAQRQMRPVTDEMTESAAEFNDELLDLTTNIGGFADKISMNLMPQINDVLGGMNDWIGLNRELINSGLDTFFDSIDESAVAIAASLGLITAGSATLAAGGLATKIGLTGTGAALAGTGGLAAKTGGVGLAAVSGFALGTVLNEQISPETSSAIGDFLGTDFLRIGALLGDKGAEEILENRRNQDRPIQLTTSLVLDGKVIDKQVQTIIGVYADQAIDDLKSTEGG
jgi:hypothetical protein